MLADLATLVGTESFSDDEEQLAVAAATVADMGARHLGSEARWHTTNDRTTLHWKFGEGGRALILGHYDTVWPTGTVTRWPFSLDEANGIATGPGVYDMKAGIVQTYFALGLLRAEQGDAALDGLEVLWVPDEETGSLSSKHLTVERALECEATLVVEPSAKGGAVKTGRKGCGMYTYVVLGKSSHAGLNPEAGVNALVAMAPLIAQVERCSNQELGTTVVPTMLASGTATNVVPAEARMEIDVRVAVPEEAARVDADLHAMAVALPGAELEVLGGPTRPPLAPTSGAALFAAYRAGAERMGLSVADGVTVGGASDGNFTAGAGCPTLDGLGPVGDGAHMEGEYVLVAALAERAALLAELISSLPR